MQSLDSVSPTFIIISVILSTIVIGTIVGNVFVIVAILIDKNLQTSANQLVLSLAVADLMVACLVMPLGAYNEVNQGWYLGKEICEFWTSADVLCCTASILNLLAIALDRYWAVTSVDYIYRRTKRRVNMMILYAWTVGAVVSLAPIFGWKDPDFADRVLIEHKCLVSQDVAYQIFATVSTFYAPLVLLLALYWRIFQVARKRIRRKPGRDELASLKRSARRSVAGASQQQQQQQQLKQRLDNRTIERNVTTITTHPSARPANPEEALDANSNYDNNLCLRESDISGPASSGVWRLPRQDGKRIKAPSHSTLTSPLTGKRISGKQDSRRPPPANQLFAARCGAGSEGGSAGAPAAAAANSAAKLNLCPRQLTLSAVMGRDGETGAAQVDSEPASSDPLDDVRAPRFEGAGLAVSESEQSQRDGNSGCQPVEGRLNCEKKEEGRSEIWGVEKMNYNENNGAHNSARLSGQMTQLRVGVAGSGQKFVGAECCCCCAACLQLYTNSSCRHCVRLRAAKWPPGEEGADESLAARADGSQDKRPDIQAGRERQKAGKVVVGSVNHSITRRAHLSGQRRCSSSTPSSCSSSSPAAPLPPSVGPLIEDLELASGSPSSLDSDYNYDDDDDEYEREEDASSLSSSFPPPIEQLNAQTLNSKSLNSPILPVQSGYINNNTAWLASVVNKAAAANAASDQEPSKRQKHNGMGASSPVERFPVRQSNNIERSVKLAARDYYKLSPSVSLNRCRLQRQEETCATPGKQSNSVTDAAHNNGQVIRRRRATIDKSDQRTMRSLDLRRKFRALGQLVSFVQTSKGFNSTSSSTGGFNDSARASSSSSSVASSSSSASSGDNGSSQSRAEPGDLAAGRAGAQAGASRLANGVASAETMSCLQGKQVAGANLTLQPIAVLNESAAPEKRSNEPAGNEAAKGVSVSTGASINQQQQIQGRRRENMDIRREKKAAKTLAIITGVFVCCWLPFFLNAIIMSICGPSCTPSDLILSILLWLGYLNSLLNPIIYTIFSPDFRRAFRRLLCWPQLVRLKSRFDAPLAATGGAGAGSTKGSALKN